MASYWILFASVTVVGSLMYNVGMKFGTANTSAFAFVLMVSLILFLTQTASFLIAKYAFHVDVTEGLEMRNILFAVLAGLGVAIIDLFYFFAFRYGTPIQCQMFWTVGGLIALTIFAVIVFREPMPLTKALGIVLGIVGLVLVVRS